MLAQKNPYIESAYEHLQIISQDKEKRLAYEAREKAIRDHNQLMREAIEQGIEQGMEQGIEAGKKIGMEQEAERINKLNQFLIQSKRFADLERSASDKDFQEQLMQEYGLASK